eukprot:scaffold62071_cov31-Tisochrysis_lutea.AAC.1
MRTLVRGVRSEGGLSGSNARTFFALAINAVSFCGDGPRRRSAARPRVARGRGEGVWLGAARGGERGEAGAAPAALPSLHSTSKNGEG